MASLSRHVARLDKDHIRRKRRGQPDWLKHVDVIDFLERCEVANISFATKDEILFSCPFPGHSHGDEKPSAYMNNGSVSPRDNTKFKCHGCQRSGNAISFLADHEGISRQQATRELKKVYSPGFTKPRDGIGAEFDRRRIELAEEREQQRLGKTIPTIPWDDYYESFGVDWRHVSKHHRNDEDVAYMLDRGLTVKTLEHWSVGYDERSDRITIPICNEQGELVGVKARALDRDVRPKYLILGDKPKPRNRRKRKPYGFRHYEKSLVVFGLHECQKNDGRLVFVEGEIDVISLWQVGIPAICTGGASMSVEQARLIRRYCDEVILFLDDDNAGSNGVWGIDTKDGEHKPGIIETLEPFVRLRLVGRHKRDPNDYLRRGEIDRVERLISKAKPTYLLRRPEILL